MTFDTSWYLEFHYMLTSWQVDKLTNWHLRHFDELTCWQVIKNLELYDFGLPSLKLRPTDSLTDWLTRVKSRDASASKNQTFPSNLPIHLNWWYMGKGVDSPKRWLRGMTHCEVSWPCPGHWRMSGLLRYRGVPKHSQHQLRTRGV